MATEAQRLVQKRSSLLRDLAGCRAQLSRIHRELQKLGVSEYSFLAWINSAIDLLHNRDKEARDIWGYRPIPTAQQWLAEQDAKHARRLARIQKKFSTPQESLK